MKYQSQKQTGKTWINEDTKIIAAEKIKMGALPFSGSAPKWAKNQITPPPPSSSSPKNPVRATDVYVQYIQGTHL